MYLEKINSPEDLKQFNMEECVELAKEIRVHLLEAVSKKGGHLSSNLGIVELTIAMHYVFQSPKDKMIFDTSHQCYVHKVLTGRKKAYMDIEYYGDNTGYTNPKESIHDLFEFGHTSTSISLACGMAKARDLRGDKENVIAVIGDGALGGGEALEGLNYGGSDLKSNLIIIFNDNQMSIAENHGGIYTGLKQLRESKGRTENNIFKFLGYEYYFVEDGHNIAQLVELLKKVKDCTKPTVIHICTKKGKGYTNAEKDQENTHFVKSFNIEKGDFCKTVLGERYDIIVRDYLLKKMKKDSSVAFVTAAMPIVLGFNKDIRSQIGKQYIDVGIAEEHAVSMIGGMAKRGGKPVFATRATFFQRAYDQISQELCLNKLAATLIVINASIYATTDKTHLGIYDIAMMSNIPNLVYLAPTNKQEYLAMLEWSIEQNEYPVAIRAPRNGVFYAKHNVERNYSRLNRFQIESEGEKIAVIALGDFFQLGEKVVEKVEEKLHISATLINPRYITGIDEEMLEKLTYNHQIIITLEDGILDGGFGQKIASFYGKKDIKVINYGFKKEFFDNFDVETFLEKNRLNPDQIVEDIEKLI